MNLEITDYVSAEARFYLGYAEREVIGRSPFSISPNLVVNNYE